MYNIIFNWHPFKAHLPSLHALIKQNSDVTKYCGMSADIKLTLHFQEEILDECIIANLQGMWDGLTEEGEAAKFKLDADREDAVNKAKNSMLLSDMTTWIPAERKIWMNMPLTNDDLDSLIAKQGATK